MALYITPGRLNRVSGHKSGFMDGGGGGTWGHGAEGSGIFLGGCKAERNETHLCFWPTRLRETKPT